MSRILFYNHVKGLLNRLPNHYKKRYMENRKKPPINYLTNDHSPLSSIENDIAPEIVYPPESDKCLWHGEGLVMGFTQKKQLHVM